MRTEFSNGKIFAISASSNILMAVNFLQSHKVMIFFDEIVTK